MIFANIFIPAKAIVETRLYQQRLVLLVQLILLWVLAIPGSTLFCRDKLLSARKVCPYRLIVKPPLAWRCLRCTPHAAFVVTEFQWCTSAVDLQRWALF